MIRRLVIKRREPFAGGHEFSITGAYEKLAGKLYGEVDPKNKPNKIIVNLDKAPRNRRGRVEYSTDFLILKPVDMARGNGKIFYDAPNRGGKRILAFLNDGPQSNDPTTLQDAGNGFLMRQGYTVVWCGWQGDLMPAKDWLVLNVPIANHRGKEIVCQTRCEIVVDEKGVKSQPLSGDDRVKSYEAATRDKVASFAHRARKVLRPKAHRAFFGMGVCYLPRKSTNRQRNDKTQLQRSLSPRRLPTGAYIRIRLPRKKSARGWFGLCGGTRSCFVLALRDQRRERQIESAG